MVDGVVHDESVRRSGGVGLGLNISRRLTQLLRGELTFSSRLGEGSTFCLTMPTGCDAAELSRADGARRSLNGNHRVSLAGRHILVVEDNPDTRKFLTYLLEERGARVTTADEGSRAVESVQSAARRGEVIDLILMDMQMPVMDGYTATRALRAAGVRTRVVALTAHAMADDHQRCVEAGCDAYLSKPIVEDVFFETITGFLPGTSSAVAPQVRPWLEACKREFRASLPATRELLESAVRANDLGAVKTLAHRLRGMAGTMGLPELGRVAGACEDALRRDPGADLSIAAAELLRCLGDFGS